MLLSFLSVLFSLLIIALSIFSLGNFLVGRLFANAHPGERILIGAFLGVAVNASLMAFLGLIFGIDAYWLVLLTSFIGLLKINDWFSNLKITLGAISKERLLIIFSIIATASMASTIFFSGIVKNGKLEFQEIHDSVWHLALIKELKINFPPAHPAFDQVELKQYHYFYDLLIAGISKVSGAPATILFFQVFTLILSGLLIASAGALGWRMNKKHGAFWLEFFTAFVGSFAYLIPVFIHGNSWSESSFWVSQTFVMMVNPQVILTLGLSYIVILIASSSLEMSWKKHLLLMLLIAPSIGFKSYSWVVLSVVYGAILGWQFLIEKKQKIRVIFYGLIYTMLSFPFVWLVTGFKTGTFFYHPLWYLNSMVEISDRLNLVEWYLKEEHYRMKGNWPRVWEIKIKELIIFYFGNLGIRLIFLILLPLALIRKKLNKKDVRLIFICFLGFLFATAFPLLFLQRGIVWNSIQFWYYGLIFANILTAFFLSKITRKLDVSENIFLLFLIVSLAVPTYIKTLAQKVLNREYVDQKTIIEISEFSKSDNVLICHEKSIFYDTSIVSAFSPAGVYVANPVQLELVEGSLEPVKELQQIFETGDVYNLSLLITKNNVNKIICSDNNRIHTIEQFIENSEEFDYQINDFDGLKIYHLTSR